MPLLDRKDFTPDSEPQARILLNVLLEVYEHEYAVRRLVKAAGLRPSDIDWGGLLADVWPRVLEHAAKSGKLRQLVTIVADEPNSTAYSIFAELLDQVAVSHTTDRPVVESPEPEAPPGTWDAYTDPSSLERQIFPVATFQDVAFLRRGAEQATAVCRLLLTDSRGERYHGTAFRVGRDLLLTNHHVLHSPDGAPMEQVEAWFNYEQDLDGRHLEHVTVTCDPASIVGDADNDWAVVRVTEPLPTDAAVVRLPKHTTVKVGDRVYIIQHPHGGVKKLAAQHNVVRYVNDQIVQYWTDTEKGSSGAPVFDEQWRLVALHRRQARTGPLSGPPEFRNEGIRIEQITADLANVADEPKSASYSIFTELLGQVAASHTADRPRTWLRPWNSPVFIRAVIGALVCAVLITVGVLLTQRPDGGSDIAKEKPTAAPSADGDPRHSRKPSTMPTASASPTSEPSTQPTSRAGGSSTPTASGIATTPSAPTTDAVPPQDTTDSGQSDGATSPPLDPTLQVTGSGPVKWTKDGHTSSYKTTADGDENMTGQLYQDNQMVNLNCQKEGDTVTLDAQYSGPSQLNGIWFRVASSDSPQEEQWLPAVYVEAQPYPLPSCP